MEWKTLATLALALIAAVVGNYIPAASGVAEIVTGLCIGSLLPQPKTWKWPRRQPAIPDQREEEPDTKPIEDKFLPR